MGEGGSVRVDGEDLSREVTLRLRSWLSDDLGETFFFFLGRSSSEHKGSKAGMHMFKE